MRGLIKKSPWAWALLLIGSIAVGCAALGEPGTGGSSDNPATSPRGILRTIPTKVDSVSQNGIWQNGLSTNGIWQNGIWQNGIWQNGIWQNGIWQNGIWQNGIWQNGIWQNGIWQNGIWQNGIWQNGIWQNGIWQNGIWQNGLSVDGGLNAEGGGPSAEGGAQSALPGGMLRTSPYARKLLEYVYACAMPAATLDPADGGTGTSYDTTLDPNGGTLTCSPEAGSEAGPDAGGCDIGYTCSAQGTCVIPLIGAIGLGINADGSTWWGQPAPAGSMPDGGPGNAGNCDESCQRWVSACVLARTNAYGVRVNISMRAPADAPQAIKDALKVSEVERNGSDAGDAPYSLREGAYYGNIFETTPVDPAPSSGSGQATGPVAQTPSFNACAGPGSNIPEITKRFCSSQGDQVVIQVPGVCLGTATELGTCIKPDGTAGEDTEATSPTFGAIQDCYTGPSTKTDAGGIQPSGTPFKEVITVYLQQPIAVCGNSVCETGEADSNSASYCPSDCHPGTWAKDLSPNIEQNVVDQTSSSITSVVAGMSVVAPDDTVVVAGTAQGDINLGADGGPLSASPGVGVLAKYHSDGSYAWGVRFGNTPAVPVEAGNDAGPSVSAQLQQVNGVTVASSGPSKGNITVVGLAVDINGVQYVWIGTYTPDGVPVGTWILPNDSGATLQPTRAFAVDSQGDIILAGGYLGTATFGSTSLTSTAEQANGTDTFIVKISPPGPDAALSLPAVVWAQSLSSTASNPQVSFPLSLAVDSTDDNIVLLDSESSNNDTPHLNVVIRKFSSDGSTVLWTQELGTDTIMTSGLPVGDSFYSAASVDSSGNVYATGYAGVNGVDFGGGVTANDSQFIVKYDKDGNVLWTNYAQTACPPPTASVPKCNLSAVEGVSIGFDPRGSVILASFGDPAVGGSIDFTGIVASASDAAVRAFPAFPAYHSNNIFLAAYAPDFGALLWAKQIPTILRSNLLGMAIDSQGRVVVSGNYSGSMQVDDQLLVTPVPEDPNVIDSFLASFGGPSPTDKTPPVNGAGADQTGTAINTVPNNIVAQATSSAGAVVFYMPPTAIDTGYAGTSVTCSPPPNTTFPIGTTIVTCTASDPLGNQSSVTFTITVVDTIGPVFSPVTEVAAQATGAGGATVTYTAPTATDQVDGAIDPSTITCAPASGSVFAVGKTTVTCTASDKSGNQAQTTFSVNVTSAADTTPPSISVPAPMTVAATGASGAVVPYGASATDDVGVATFACSPASGSTFAIGTTPVTCTASDAAGNTSSASFTVTVADQTPPSLTVPANLKAEATGPSGATVVYTASATDNVDGTVVPTCLPGSDSVFALGTTTVTCTASDAAGNKASATFTVTVVDTTPPALTVPSAVTVAATGAGGAVVTFSASAADLVDGTRPVTCSPASGSTFAIGTTPVTCSASDTRGNASSATFPVTVVESAPPTLTLPATITATATSSAGATVSYSASATDPVDGSITPVCTPASGSTFAPGTTTVTCTATDAHGNKATGSFKVQVQYAWSGILLPIHADGSSIFDLGSTVRVRFALSGASAGISNAAPTLTVTKVSSTVAGSHRQIPSSAQPTTGSTFKYNPVTKHYYFNLGTNKLSTGTYSLAIDLHDGVSRTAQISLQAYTCGSCERDDGGD